MEPKKNPSADIHRKQNLIFAFSLALTMSMAVIAFSWRFESNTEKNQVRVTDTTPDEMLEIPSTQHLPPPIPVIRSPHIIEVPDDEEVKEDIKVNLDLEDDTPIEPVAVKQPIEEEETHEIMTFVESPPQFPGGGEAMLKFIQQNLKYPGRARRMGIEGRVFIKAVIERDGTISGVEVMKGIGAGCDEEALQVIRSFPIWIPGKQRGKPVRVRITFPIKFTLDH